MIIWSLLGIGGKRLSPRIIRCFCWFVMFWLHDKVHCTLGKQWLAASSHRKARRVGKMRRAILWPMHCDLWRCRALRWEDGFLWTIIFDPTIGCFKVWSRNIMDHFFQQCSSLTSTSFRPLSVHCECFTKWTRKWMPQALPFQPTSHKMTL